MTCEEVRNHLLEYFDKTLDAPMMTRVATHLISCAPCGAEATELANCIHEVAALPTIDPPLGFAERVMAHVRELEAKPTIWERLFSLWNRNFPLQATAVVLIGITAAFLYHKEEQLKQRELNETAMKLAAVESKSARNDLTPVTPLKAEKKEELSAKPAREKEIVKRVEPAPAKRAASLSSSDQIPNVKSDIEAGLEERNDAPRKAPIPVQRDRNFRDVGGFNPGMPFGGVRQAAPWPAPAERSLAPLAEPAADVEFVVRRRPPQRFEAESDVDSLRKSAETDATPGRAPGSMAPSAPAAARMMSFTVIRFYNVAPEHYDSFKQELAAEAIVESETRLAKEALPTDRPLLIKLTILPSASSDPSAPSR